MPFLHTYWIFFSVVIHVSSPQVDKVTYDDSQVWQVDLRSPEDVQLIKRLIDSQDISIWSLTPTRADFLVRGHHKVKVNRQLVARKLDHTVLIMDVQRRINNDIQQIVPSSSLWTETTLRVGHRLRWDKFPTLNIIEEYYNFLAEEYSSICRVQTIGYTAENRTIKMINITNGNPKNDIILITGGSHAREWVSVTSALYILDNIVTEFDSQRSYIKNKNWLIIPVWNPDGYVYTHTVDRLWRKNRSNFTHCKGVDLNRNFDADWDIAGITENNECKMTYSGPYAFSEAETRALRELVLSLKQKPVAMMDLHSYGKLILFPWTARKLATQDFDTHMKMAEAMRSSIFKETKENYTYGATYHKIYPATGTLLDWAYAEGVVHSYVIEINEGKLGFLVPPEEIEDIGKELFAAVRALSKHVSSPTKQNESNDNQTTWF